MEPSTKEIVWTYQERRLIDFFTPFISNAQRLPNGQHPELLKPEPKPRTARGDAVTSLEKRVLERADALYHDKWGVKPDGMRSVKAKKIKPERKIV